MGCRVIRFRDSHTGSFKLSSSKFKVSWRVEGLAELVITKIKRH